MKPFIFKQFTINQDRCAMKVGTDAVLLGAWTPVDHHPISILDIGSGTGILSLMLAQRSNAVPIAIGIIDAIEIDEDAYEQCVENFEQSQWNDRLFCYHASLLEFTEEIEDKYELIVSNPPFFSPSLASPSLPLGEKTMSFSRKTARFQYTLPFEHLVESVSKLLSKRGVFSVILPFQEEENFLALASKVNLFSFRILHVKGNPSSEIKRSLISFSFNKKDIKTEDLIIETSRHVYTKDYIDLTKGFYLKM
jgi:tRNA1Val (adenine37-N6)-methyltransferase